MKHRVGDTSSSPVTPVIVTLFFFRISPQTNQVNAKIESRTQPLADTFPIPPTVPPIMI